MNEIRQLCTTGSSPGKHLDEILALFHACPPEHLLPSLSLIGQSISCMSIEQLDIHIINHQIFLLIRQWSERLFQLWLINGTLNSDEYRAIFYIHQLFKLLSEWLNEQENIILTNKNKKLIEDMMKNLFLDENFLQTLSRCINQLITTENNKQQNIISGGYLKEDQISSDDIQAEQADVLDVLYRCINSLVILYSHRTLINHSLIEDNLTPCIFNCLNSSLFLQFSMEFLRQKMANDKRNIRSIFLLFTCLDYCIFSRITTTTLELIPSIYQIFHFWGEIPRHGDDDDDISLLIIRLIRFLNQLVEENKETILRENICSSLLPHFQILCQTPNLIDDITSFIVTLCSITTGKEHLRQLGFVQYILHEVKHNIQLWQPLGLLITQQDLYQISFFKRLIHLLIQRTVHIFQSLTTASNDTSFDSISPTSKHQIILTAIDWFILLRTNFLSFSMIIDELINSTKKVNLINMLIDTILSLEQEDGHLAKLIEVMIELLWTFTFNTSMNIHDRLKKRLDLCQWLKTNKRLASQMILSMLDLNTRNIIRHHGSFLSNILICMFNTDESHQELCITLRDRLQIEEHYSVELFITSTCQSIDSLIQLMNRSSLCLFCSSKSMKNDNLAHFIYHYFSHQSHPIPLLAILPEHDLEFEGNWLENLPIIDIPSILKEIRRYLNQNDHTPIDLPRPINDISPDEIKNPSQDYMQRSVCYWSSDDVIQWCEATQGNFESLRPLVRRLNGSALVNLAEILSIEPASMYHCLNDELLQRTGSTVPLTEYVSLRSELQRLLLEKPPPYMTMSLTDTNSRKKKWKHSRFCTLF